ncbi:MAG: ABC transporter permease subunit [Solirubrobacteraceae bacterium]|nr:ABC transporter permease subunit [Solirubrobacteraceae bacterium]
MRSSFLRTLAALAVLLGAWEAACAIFDVDPSTLPAPSDAWAAFVDAREVLLPALQVTSIEAVGGLLAALLLGGVLGLLMAAFRPVRTTLEPVLVVTQTIPIIAIAPLLVTWLGFGLGPKLVVVTLIAVFPIIVAVAQGVRQADSSVEELLRGAGAGRFRRLRLVEVPAAVPAMLAGARVSALLVVPGAVAAELVGATDGLGRLLLIYDRDGRTELTFACVLLLAALGLTLWAVVSGADRWSTKRGLVRSS